MTIVPTEEQMADKEPSPDQMIASLLQGKSRREMMVIRISYSRIDFNSAKGRLLFEELADGFRSS